MQIQNTFVAKQGPGGKRNRAKRRRLERRSQGRSVCASVGSTETLVEFTEPEIQLDLSVAWDESIARKALELQENSGQSQRAFAAKHQFPESRLRSWKKKLQALFN